MQGDFLIYFSLFSPFMLLNHFFINIFRCILPFYVTLI
ncbi:hypothetical protein FM106_11660 [Brachybacterium faecium]|nr:hypothetical protein FM106_11660 [Brachybacterium faecium]